MSTAQMVEDIVEKSVPGTFLRARDVSGSPQSVDTAWSRLLDRRDDLIRIRRGLYWKGAHTRFGVTRPSAMSVALEVAGSGAGPAGWSALAALGLTTQVPARQEIAAVGHRPQFDKVKVTARTNVGRAGLRPLEVAVLEALRPQWSSRADLPLESRLSDLIADGQIRGDSLLRASVGETHAVREALEKAMTHSRREGLIPA